MKLHFFEFGELSFSLKMICTSSVRLSIPLNETTFHVRFIPIILFSSTSEQTETMFLSNFSTLTWN